jgi:hypothetical protein
VDNGRFKVISSATFGWMVKGNRLEYFNGHSDTAALQVTADRRLTVRIGRWSADRMEWVQEVEGAGGSARNAASSLTYVVHQLKPDAAYRLTVNGKATGGVRSDAKGDLVVRVMVSQGDERILIQKKIL